MVAVLVIDPRKNYRDVLSDALGRWFTVYRAASLVEAAQAWSLHKPEAALASIVQTGDTHGLDLLARFRKGARGRSITLVAYGRPSGQSVSGDRLDQVCRSKGLDGWIAQTLEPQEMQAKVLGILLRLQTLDTHGDVRTIRSSTDSAPPPVLSARRAPPRASTTSRTSPRPRSAWSTGAGRRRSRAGVRCSAHRRTSRTCGAWSARP